MVINDPNPIGRPRRHAKKRRQCHWCHTRLNETEKMLCVSCRTEQAELPSAVRKSGFRETTHPITGNEERVIKYAALVAAGQLIFPAIR